jgi:CRISPR/Cas system-associated exonuclease Cas4 (RecB family)
MDKSILPNTFHFSQSNLSDWQTCHRRFQYRHLQRRPYPAPQTASEDLLEYERHLRQGEDFHRLVAQHLSGIEAERLTDRIDDDVLKTWWENYLAFGLQGIPQAVRQVETVLTAPIGDYRLLAKYDLLAAAPDTGRIVIVDWKTSRHRPRQSTLERQMQTLMYRYLAVEAAAYYLNWEPVLPENVEMIYWFANHPDQPERLVYSAERYQRDKDYLAEIVTEIVAEQEFQKVDEAEKAQVCRYCEYRTLCWEDVTAGRLKDMDNLVGDEAEDFDFEFDLEQIAEIEF